MSRVNIYNFKPKVIPGHATNSANTLQYNLNLEESQIED